MLEGNNIVREEEYYQERTVKVGEKAKVTWGKSKRLLGVLRDAVFRR